MIQVDDVDAEFRRLRAAGVEFSTVPQDREWRARHAWLTDPDGYRLSLFSDLTPGVRHHAG